MTLSILFDDPDRGDLDLRLFEADGTTMVAQSRSFDMNEIITCPGPSPSCPLLTPADYIFLVFPAVSGQTNEYNIDLAITAGSGSGSN